MGGVGRGRFGTFEAVVTGVGAALYAGVGYLTWLGVLGLNFMGVRFWPAVVIPSTLATLFGPWVGGASAAIGIFLSDMASHGMALLSLTVGVPANFLAFYIIGALTDRESSVKRLVLANTLGLAVGSLWIGLGLTVWSRFFLLPFHSEMTPLSLAAGASVAAWTFVTEAPFLYLVVPPLVRAVGRAVRERTQRVDARPNR